MWFFSLYLSPTRRRRRVPVNSSCCCFGCLRSTRDDNKMALLSGNRYVCVNSCALSLSCGRHSHRRIAVPSRARFPLRAYECVSRSAEGCAQWENNVRISCIHHTVCSSICTKRSTLWLCGSQQATSQPASQLASQSVSQRLRRSVRKYNIHVPTNSK